MKIDLVYFPRKNDNLVPRWSHGAIRALPVHIHNAMVIIDSLIRSSDSEFTLLWDFNIGEVPEELIKNLSAQTIDVWHGGLRLGLQSQPHLINYVYPTWMYNYDVDAEVISTSFRLSLRACLFRNKVWLAVGGADGGYSTVAMIGLDLGYRWIKAGALIRYSPQLISGNSKKDSLSIPLVDQFRFIRKHFSQKWILWVLYRNLSKDFFGSVKAWFKTRKIKTQEILPSINKKLILKEIFRGEVSVLIPTLNRYPYLINELEQLKRQSLKPLEILITDQTDVADRTSEFALAYKELTIRYFPQESKGQCIAWNKLLEEAKGEYVLFLGDDADAIYPDFIQDLMNTLHQYDADIVAAHVEEVGIPQSNKFDGFVKITDGFPICLVRRALIEQAGHMDMVFNKDIRADHDLAMRCHQLGALMIYDYASRILHHRAPSGGLRTHQARAKTRYQSKNTISTLVFPTTSEIYLTKKYFSPELVGEEIRIRKLSLLFINGNAIKKLIRIVFVLIR